MTKMNAKHMSGTVSFMLVLCFALVQQGGRAAGQVTTESEGGGIEHSFTQEPQLKGIVSDDPIPDAVHQQQLQSHSLQHTGLADDLAGADPDTEGNARIRAPLSGSRSKSISATSVLFMTTLMSSASGIGALPFFFVGALSKEWAALANAVACGVMLAASFDLLHEGQPYGAGMVIFGLVLGALFINATQERLQQFEDIKFQGLQGTNARKLVLVVGIMAAHALGEGSGVGVSFCGTRGWAQGLLVTLAIGLHNIPEGLAVATVLVAKGISARRAFWWTLFTSAPQPLVALPSFLFVDTFFQLLPLALGFAAGCMLWMVFAELLPDALNDAKHSKVATAATFSAAWLEGLRMMLARFEQPDGGFSVVADNLDLGETLGKCTALLTVALPATAIGAFMGAVVPRAAASFGAAAGVAAWVGLADTAYRLGRDPRLQAVRFLASIATGAGVAVLLNRSKKSKGSKLDVKDEDGPARAGDSDWQVVSASDRSLLLPEAASTLPVLHPAAARRASKGGVSMAQLQAATSGMLALALHGVPEGWIIAETVQNHGGVGHAWAPAALRAMLKAGTVALLAPHMGWGSPSLAGSASMLVSIVAPFVAGCMVMQGSGEASRQGLGMQEVTGACLGVLLATGLTVLWPAARHGRKRAGRAGFMLGFLSGAAVYGLLEVMCWASSLCLVM